MDEQTSCRRVVLIESTLTYSPKLSAEEYNYRSKRRNTQMINDYF